MSNAELIAEAGKIVDVAGKDAPLTVRGLTVSYGNKPAVFSVDASIPAGSMTAIIGPNGAGKTTMMDIITGKTRPDTGDVMFRSEVDLTKLDEAEIANLGIGRKFQKPTVFESHTVFDNLLLACSGGRGVFQALFHLLGNAEKLRIEQTLETIMLTDKREETAANLSHGQKQWLEIGMLLMQEPELLLVDEPVAGMTDSETEQTAKLLRSIAMDRSVVVVEHDMEFVRDLDCKVTVLHEGSVLAEGRLDHVQKDPRVIEVYLGR